MANDHLEPSPLTWLGGNRRLARRVGRPVRNFLRIEAAGGLLLIVATVVALVWANSPWSHSYHELLETHISLHVGDLLHLDEPLEAWINDALMAIFFFVVGLEIKRELVAGELRDPRAAALPAIAAIGGMVVPALVYVAFASGGMGADGWGIPMATDIAFAVGVVSLLGNRVPGAMKVFLLTLAIVDDIGAIAVIAIFYTEDLSTDWLLIATGLTVLVVLMRLMRIWYIPVYALVGFFLWLAVFESGIHATIAGVVLGLLTPAVPLRDETPNDDVHIGAAISGQASATVVRRANFELKEQVSVAERLETMLHPFSSFLIIPIFALANAGIEISGDSLSNALSSDVTLGVVFGLVVGKLVGVSFATWVAVKSGISRLPRGASFTHVVGLAAIAGIGFTVSLFITGLAFPEGSAAIDEAKLGILAASIIAAVVGSLTLLRANEVIEIDIDDPDVVNA
ncbi:MAG: Na+/H+ antiporter NhaA [Acidimicrobiaceae bacterium]|jgi:Na+:H+ antiporter, NhaA family|nr:Na+/H+ antiporter NhaA [Acidimicrobiaceae bacterium]MBT5581444.1 Na+/H+ antiporter NhaA [Acidimicrobiaceae bacterium]MBT5851706.1 Na+/H+ antiporter NhaA [Acidimicrobiaceae bacterium]